MLDVFQFLFPCADSHFSFYKIILGIPANFLIGSGGKRTIPTLAVFNIDVVKKVKGFIYKFIAKAEEKMCLFWFFFFGKRIVFGWWGKKTTPNPFPFFFRFWQ